MDVGPEVDLQCPALIPDDYLPDIPARLVLYKRIANCDTEAQLRELQIEMIDRFGLLPEPVKNLFSLTELKQQAAQLGLKKIDASAGGGRLVFGQDPKINTEQLLLLIQKQAQLYKFDGANKLRFLQTFESTAEKVQFIRSLLEKLTLTTG
jgi:transcription-repair coupling factor (superfamily II helicase)